MSDIEDFLMSYVEPILRRARETAQRATTEEKPIQKKSQEKIPKHPEPKPCYNPEIPLKEQYENDLTLLEFYSNNFYSNNLNELNKKIINNFKKHKLDKIVDNEIYRPISLLECKKCPFSANEKACKKFRKSLGLNYVCEKYQNKKFKDYDTDKK